MSAVEGDRLDHRSGRGRGSTTIFTPMPWKSSGKYHQQLGGEPGSSLHP